MIELWRKAWSRSEIWYRFIPIDERNRGGTHCYEGLCVVVRKRGGTWGTVTVRLWEDQDAANFEAHDYELLTDDQTFEEEFLRRGVAQEILNELLSKSGEGE